MQKNKLFSLVLVACLILGLSSCFSKDPTFYDAIKDLNEGTIELKEYNNEVHITREYSYTFDDHNMKIYKDSELLWSNPYEGEFYFSETGHGNIKYQNEMFYYITTENKMIHYYKVNTKGEILNTSTIETEYDNAYIYVDYANTIYFAKSSDVGIALTSYDEDKNKEVVLYTFKNTQNQKVRLHDAISCIYYGETYGVDCYIIETYDNRAYRCVEFLDYFFEGKIYFSKDKNVYIADLEGNDGEFSGPDSQCFKMKNNKNEVIFDYCFLYERSFNYFAYGIYYDKMFCIGSSRISNQFYIVVGEPSGNVYYAKVDISPNDVENITFYGNVIIVKTKDKKYEVVL